MPVAIIVAIAGALGAAAGAAIVGTAASTLAISVASAIGASLFASAAAMLLAPSYNAPSVYSPSAKTVRQTRTITTRQPLAPWQIIYGETRVGGTITYMEGSTDNRFLHIVITVSAHVLDSFRGVWFDDHLLILDGSGNVTWPSQYAGHARVQFSLGNEAGQPFPDLVTESNGLWTDAHRQAGFGKVYVRLEFDATAYPNGVPNITVQVRGRTDIYDPRGPTTGYTSNAALCIANYLCNSDFGAGAVYATDIDEATLIAAANICDETVNLASGGTENRYSLNGVFEVNGSVEDILPRLYTAMAARATLVGGKWYLYAGAFVSPSYEITEKDIRGPLQVTTRFSKRDLFNSVRGVYVEPSYRYQPTNFPPVSNATYRAEDNDEYLWQVFDLPFTQSAATAQRIAKLELERARQQITVNLKCQIDAYVIQPGDTFYLTLSHYGWSQKIFEAIEVSLSVEDGVLATNIVGRETASAVFDWNSGYETTVDPAPDTNLPNPFSVGVPSNIIVTEQLFQSLDSGGVSVRAIIDWTPPQDWFSISGLATYELGYKTSVSTVWYAISTIKEPQYTLIDIAPGAYDFRVRAYNVYGGQGAYAYEYSHNIYGLTAPPSDVQSFSVHPSAGLAHMTWGLHPDLDVRIGGKIEIRHTTHVTSYVWPDTALIALVDGISTQAVGPLRAGAYLARARDSLGTYSINPSAFIVTEALMTGFTTVASVVEHPNFVGTKVNLVVEGVTLVMSGPTTPLSGTYFWPGSVAAYPTYVDLGSVSARRFETVLGMFRYDDNDLIDNRGLIDTWSSVDGGDVNQGEALIYIATTDDDPSGTPAWGAWTLFRVAEFNCRAVKLKVEYERFSSSHNVGVDELALFVKDPV